MAKANNKSVGWSAVRQQLTTWEKPALLALVKDLYTASDVGRDLVNTRCQRAQAAEAILEKYRRKIVEQFFPARGFGKLKLGEARQAIRDYRKATDHLPGTAELLLTYVENGADFTRQFGDIDERFYNSLESALDELAVLCAVRRRNVIPGSQNGSRKWSAWPAASAGALATLSATLSRSCIATSGKAIRLSQPRLRNNNPTSCAPPFPRNY